MAVKKHVRLILLLAGAGLYLVAVVFCQLTRRETSKVYILLDQSLTVSQTNQILDQEGNEDTPVSCCFWDAGEMETISCPQTGVSVQATTIFLSGNAELMDAGLLVWTEGCYLDQESAQTLFGNGQSGGQTLRRGEDELPALGTISASRPTLITMAQPEDEASFSRCILELPADNGTAMAEQFLLRHQITGTVLDYSALLALMENLLLLFPGILLVSAWSRLGSGWRALSLEGIRSGQQRKLLGKTALALCLAGMTVFLLGRKIRIPLDMIPSRWSDFSFWGNWWEGQKENLMNILSAAPENGHLQMQIHMVKSMISSIGAALLALWAMRRDRHADITD